MHKSFSEDLFTSQESELIASSQKTTGAVCVSRSSDDKDLGTQTFSILDTTKAVTQLDIPVPGQLSMGCDTQPYEVSYYINTRKLFRINIGGAF